MSLQHRPTLSTVLVALDANLQEADSLTDAERQTFWLALQPLVIRLAQTIMREKDGGLNIPEPQDLAAVGLEKLIYAERPKILQFRGSSEAELFAFVQRVLTNLVVDDQRSLVGRNRDNRSIRPSNEDSDATKDFRAERAPGQMADTERGRGTVPIDPVSHTGIAPMPQQEQRVPRVFVNVVDEEGDEFIQSERRTATGYLLLKQTRRHLEDYLRLMPGSVVMVPTGQRGDKPRLKRVTLTQSHARLLRIWMSGEGEDQWKDIAEQMDKPLSTVKRWWSEAVLSFESDGSVQAQALRELYRVNPSHISIACDTFDKDETADEMSSSAELAADQGNIPHQPSRIEPAA